MKKIFRSTGKAVYSSGIADGRWQLGRRCKRSIENARDPTRLKNGWDQGVKGPTTLFLTCRRGFTAGSLSCSEKNIAGFGWGCGCSRAPSLGDCRTEGKPKKTGRTIGIRWCTDLPEQGAARPRKAGAFERRGKKSSMVRTRYNRRTKREKRYIRKFRGGEEGLKRSGST